jgi:hypothetical protein
VSAANPGTTIIDPYDYASIAADANARAERQCPMRRRHCRTIQTLTIRCAMTAKSITPAVDARHFGLRVATKWKQQRGRKDQSETI